MSRARPVTGGPGGVVPAVGKPAIGDPLTAVADPDATGTTEDGDPVTALAGTDASGDPPGAGLVPQAAAGGGDSGGDRHREEVPSRSASHAHSTPAGPARFPAGR